MMRKKKEIMKRSLLFGTCLGLMLSLSGCKLIPAQLPVPTQTSEETEEAIGESKETSPAEQTKEPGGTGQEGQTESEEGTASKEATEPEKNTEPEKSSESRESESETDSKEPESNEETGREIEKKTFGPNIGNGLNDHSTSGRVARGDGCTWFVQSSCLDNDGRGNASFYSENLYRIGDGLYDEPELVASIPMFRGKGSVKPTIFNLIPYGDRIYHQERRALSNETEDRSTPEYALCYLDLNTGNIEEIPVQGLSASYWIISDYFPGEDHFYYLIDTDPDRKEPGSDSKSMDEIIDLDLKTGQATYEKIRLPIGREDKGSIVNMTETEILYAISREDSCIFARCDHDGNGNELICEIPREKKDERFVGIFSQGYLFIESVIGDKENRSLQIVDIKTGEQVFQASIDDWFKFNFAGDTLVYLTKDCEAYRMTIGTEEKPQRIMDPGFSAEELGIEAAYIGLSIDPEDLSKVGIFYYDNYDIAVYRVVMAGDIFFGITPTDYPDVIPDYPLVDKWDPFDTDDFPSLITEDGLVFIDYPGGIYTLAYRGTDPEVEELIIPGEIDGKPVRFVALANEDYSIKTIRISENTTSLMMVDCPTVKDIYLPKSLELLNLQTFEKTLHIADDATVHFQGTKEECERMIRESTRIQDDVPESEKDPKHLTILCSDGEYTGPAEAE